MRTCGRQRGQGRRQRRGSGTLRSSISAEVTRKDTALPVRLQTWPASVYVQSWEPRLYALAMKLSIEVEIGVEDRSRVAGEERAQRINEMHLDLGGLHRARAAA